MLVVLYILQKRMLGLTPEFVKTSVNNLAGSSFNAAAGVYHKYVHSSEILDDPAKPLMTEIENSAEDSEFGLSGTEDGSWTAQDPGPDSLEGDSTYDLLHRKGDDLNDHGGQAKNLKEDSLLEEQPAEMSLQDKVDNQPINEFGSSDSKDKTPDQPLSEEEQQDTESPADAHSEMRTDGLDPVPHLVIPTEHSEETPTDLIDEDDDYYEYEEAEIYSKVERQDSAGIESTKQEL